MNTPIIGVTTGVNPEDPKGGREFYIAYAEAAQEAGGTTVYLDPKPATFKDLEKVLDGIDGLFLTGGKDVYPDYYPSRNEPGDDGVSTDDLIAAYNMDCDPARDAYEIPLIRAAYDRGMPILGICRGFQVLNVALGGSLIKDIRTGRKHWAIRQGEEGNLKESRKHLVTISSGSKLAEILGDCLLLVNSRHHQGITEREKSEFLKATAFAPDGIVEAVESSEHPWAIAVQWHPERRLDAYIYEPCRALFSAFISAAGSNR